MVKVNVMVQVKYLLKLYREETSATVSGVKLKFIVPGISQMGLIRRMLVLGVQNLIFTPLEIEQKKEEEIFVQCLQKLADIHNINDSIKKELESTKWYTSLLLMPESASILHQLISESFPEITNPWKLTDEAKSEIIVIVLDQFYTSYKVGSEIIKDKASKFI